MKEMEIEKTFIHKKFFWVDLQWFAAEDEGRTENPTDEKLRKSREEGKVVRSQDLGAVFGLLTPFLIFLVFSRYLVTGLLNLTASYFIHLNDWDVTQTNLAVTSIFWNFFKFIWVILLSSFLVSLFINIAQVGLTITPKPLEFKLERISPNFTKWIQRSFFSTEALFNLFKSLTKLAIILIIGYGIIRAGLPSLSRISEFPIMVGVSMIAGAVVRVFLFSFVVLLIFAIVDYIFQRRIFIDSLKMSKQEVKEERRQAEGDPLLKSRLRERMRQIMSQNIRKTVPRADVVITNPTHYAVALEWNAERMVAPQVVAKGVDQVALVIIDIAKDSEVPRVENRPLARALYASVEIGDPVPPEYWELVSRILAEVYTLNQRVKL